MPATHPAARFMPRLAAWMVDIALCSIPAMFVAWAMVRVPAVAMVQEAPVAGSVLQMEQHLIQYLKFHLLAWLWLTIGLVASYALLSIICESGIHQATPGKRIMGLQVEDLHGRAPSPMQAAARFFGGGVSWITLNIGHAMAIFRADRRAAHDLMSGLRVVALPLAPGEPPRSFRIVVVIVAWLLFWAILPGPVPDSPVVEKMLEDGVGMVVSPSARSIDPPQ